MKIFSLAIIHNNNSAIFSILYYAICVVLQFRIISNNIYLVCNSIYIFNCINVIKHILYTKTQFYQLFILLQKRTKSKMNCTTSDKTFMQIYLNFSWFSKRRTVRFTYILRTMLHLQKDTDVRITGVEKLSAVHCNTSRMMLYKITHVAFLSSGNSLFKCTWGRQRETFGRLLY